jgi:asparagine synthase (glutamine-hydrolysing)
VIKAVRLRLDADRPLTFLLSGGVDSSLVAAISQRILGYPIKTFCCGMKGGTDLYYAKKVA